MQRSFSEGQKAHLWEWKIDKRPKVVLANNKKETVDGIRILNVGLQKLVLDDPVNLLIYSILCVSVC